jgi:hypothetical protein
LTERNAITRARPHALLMQTIAQKLVDVLERIAESELRITQQQERLRTSTCEINADAAFQLDAAASTLRELRAYPCCTRETAGAPARGSPHCLG